MFKEMNILAKEMKEGDRAQFFWTSFPDGCILNGGCNIIKVEEDVPTPRDEWIKEREEDNKQGGKKR